MGKASQSQSLNILAERLFCNIESIAKSLIIRNPFFILKRGLYPLLRLRTFESEIPKQLGNFPSKSSEAIQ